MISRRRIWSLVGIVFFSSLVSRSAFAAANDAQAAKLREAAIYQDYLATDFPSAEKKLTQALALCEKPADCTATTRGRLHCDLGVVYAATQKTDEANAQFAAALKEDPNVTIDADLTTPELQKQFAAAKAGGGAAAAPAAPASKPAAAAPAADTSGDDSSGDDSTDEKPAATKPAESSDCPPGFPGCKSGEPSSCANDDDCGTGEKCVDQKCSGNSESSGPAKANWVSLAIQGDGLLLPAKNDVCAGGQGYSCFNSDGSWYSGTPNTNGGGQVLGGLSLGTCAFSPDTTAPLETSRSAARSATRSVAVRRGRPRRRRRRASRSTRFTSRCARSTGWGVIRSRSRASNST